MFYFQAIWRWSPQLINVELFYILLHHHLLNSWVRKPPTSSQTFACLKQRLMAGQLCFQRFAYIQMSSCRFASEECKGWALLATMLEHPVQYSQVAPDSSLRCHHLLPRQGLNACFKKELALSSKDPLSIPNIGISASFCHLAPWFCYCLLEMFHIVPRRRRKP